MVQWLDLKNASSILLDKQSNKLEPGLLLDLEWNPFSDV